MGRGFRDDEGDSDEAVSLGEVRLKHVTDDAILVAAIGDNETFDGELWVPKTQVHDDSEVFEGMDGVEGELSVTHWWADKKGFV